MVSTTIARSKTQNSEFFFQNQKSSEVFALNEKKNQKEQFIISYHMFYLNVTVDCCGGSLFTIMCFLQLLFFRKKSESNKYIAQ